MQQEIPGSPTPGTDTLPLHHQAGQRNILFYSILDCVLPLQEVALRQSPPSFSVLCYLCPYRSLLPTMPSLQWRFGLPTDLIPFICHSVLLIVHLIALIRAMCPAHFHFILVMYLTMSVTLVLCLMMVLRILSFSLTLSIFLSIARWIVLSFFTNPSTESLLRDTRILHLLITRVKDYMHGIFLTFRTYWWECFTNKISFK